MCLVVVGSRKVHRRKKPFATVEIESIFNMPDVVGYRMILESIGARLEENLNASGDPIEKSISEGPLAVTNTGLLLSGWGHSSDISLRAPCGVLVVARVFSKLMRRVPFLSIVSCSSGNV